MARLAGRLPSKQEEAGSSPVVRSMPPAADLSPALRRLAAWFDSRWGHHNQPNDRTPDENRKEVSAVSTTTVAMSSVTLLNASYEPLGRVSFKHAVRMLFREVATVEEAHHGRRIGPHPWPKVIRLVRYVAAKWMYRPAGYSRTGVLKRDRYRCAYCGRTATTIDHVLPASRGGQWSWLNTVAACESCNLRKADRTPQEARMQLRVQPYVPTRAQLAAG